MGAKDDKIEALQSQVAASEVMISKLQAELEAAKTVANKLESERVSLVDQLEKKAAEPPVVKDCTDKDHAVVKGVKHQILKINTAKDFALSDFRKRWFDEFQTVVVIDRIGT